MKPVKTWETTRLQNLVRHKSGRYYARAFANGKEIWKSLKTSHFSVAEGKLAEFLKEHRERKSTATALERGKMTFADALAAHQSKLQDDVTAKRTKPSTVHYWKQVFTALLKSWPDLAGRDVRRITTTECDSWARKFVRSASPTRYNNTIAGLRHVFDIAVEAAVIYKNPAAKLARVPVRPKALTLPSAAQFVEMLETIRKAGGWCSKDCADFVEGLAVTGARLSDAANVTWRDIDFEAGETVIRGDAQTGTKNWEVYRVPMILRARELFERMRSERKDEPLTAKVFRVSEAQKAIDSACKKLGIPRITHHDLRHLFATICIESGVDIPTVSRWLNHKDGGALAMKTYGHLRRDHSLSSARKVTFGGEVAPSNVVNRLRRGATVRFGAGYVSSRALQGPNAR
jgi:integrase